jgi:hypothetical protein
MCSPRAGTAALRSARLRRPLRRRRLPPAPPGSPETPQRRAESGRAPRVFLTLTAPSFGPVHTRA